MNITLKMPCTPDEIRTEIKALRSEIASRQGEIDLLVQAIWHYQKQCDHKGRTSYRDWDGASDWGPCPTCGSTQ